jgi:small-conductance mechanosensitive channel
LRVWCWAWRPAQPSGNLIAGIQIALTEPIRVEDAVVVEGELGRVVEVNTTYVIVHLWDLRHLVVPLSYFIEKPFQNWTRYSSDLISVVLLYTDYTVPVDKLREEYRQILESSPLWERKVMAASDRCEGTQRRTALPDERRQSHYYLRPALLCSREVDPISSGALSTGTCANSFRGLAG